jgi:hypothetical protein
MAECPGCGADDDDGATTPVAAVVATDGAVRLMIGPVHVDNLREVLEGLACEAFINDTRAAIRATVARSKAGEN